jgi:hypothetical protein
VNEESGVIVTVGAHGDQIALVSYPVIDSHPEPGMGEVKETGEGDNRHAGGERAHRGNH